MTRQKSLSEALDSIFRGAHTPKGIAEQELELHVGLDRENDTHP